MSAWIVYVFQDIHVYINIKDKMTISEIFRAFIQGS
jgi:hypothetical protein